MFSQSGQDVFVSKLLGNKKGGTFLDIGCGHPQHINNTFLLEKEFEWTGYSLDIDPRFIEEWKTIRTNSFIHADALETDFSKILLFYKDTVIDYLSLDTDGKYVDVLKRIPFHVYQFRVLTIEHDYYLHGDLYRQPEREFLQEYGYHLVCSNVKNNGNMYEDWWVHPDLVVPHYKYLECDGLEYTNILSKFNSVTSVLIFSKDRALQLHALLSSIELNASSVYTSITVLYTCSNNQFKKGYDLVKTRFPYVQFIIETNFTRDVYDFLASVSTSYFSFLVDDTIIYNKIDIHSVSTFLNQENVLSYIPGVGMNTRISLTACLQFDPPSFDKVESSDTLVWNWKQVQHNGEFACPFMLVGNIYKKEAIEYFNWNKVQFYNPNSFEEILQYILKVQFMSKLPDLCGCPTESILLHTPNNRVQDSHPNTFGQCYNYSPKELNDRYLSGEIMDISNCDFSNIQGLHHELEFKFTSYLNQELGGKKNND